MLKILNNKKVKKVLVAYFLLSFLIEIFSPSIAFALTSGPAQEEFASFEPATTTEMVDLYTGDYNYNLPLLSVPGPNGGYPINLSYHSGIGMEQEASWVGLGWTLNVGAINRNLRGLPDDFSGDMVVKTQHVRENVTASLNIPTSSYNEFIGFPVSSSSSGGASTSNQLQLYYNNYRGLGMRYTFGSQYGSESASMGLAISHDSQNGMGIGLSFNVKNHKKQGALGFELGLDYNSRQGLQSINFRTFSTSNANFKYMDDVNGSSKVQEDGDKVGGGSTMSFATVFGVPSTNMQMKSVTVPFSLKIPEASTLYRFTSPWPISGSVYTSRVANGGEDKVPAQGYLHTNGSTSALKDFSRKEFTYSKKVPHLPSSSFTYDLYTQSGQGTGSMFRPHLNTFGVLFNPLKRSEDRVAGGGIELGTGLATTGIGVDFHLGVDFDYGHGENTSGPWIKVGNKPDYDGNFENSFLKWKPENSKIDYEPYYFQVVGEKTGFHSEDDYLKNFANDRAVRLKMSKDKSDNTWLRRHFKIEDELLYNETTTSGKWLSTSNQTVQTSSKKRSKRATSIETLNNNQAMQYGYSKFVQYYNGSTMVDKDFSKPSHHISEISVLQSDGMRYVYGLPTYNNKQIDNLFSVDEAGSINKMNATVNVGGAVNVGGINVTSTHDQFVSKNELPAYANSWLLTSIFSVDYIDATGNGPSDDDYGYWVKFNYEKVSGSYKWRAPFSGANFNDGAKNENLYNKGSYTYGEKEIYILKSIETKTHIAVFETSNRKDAYESGGEFSNSGLGSVTMKKLDKILLYSKKEYQQTSPIPTKVVNFEYSYDLCPNVENNNGATEVVSVDDGSGGHTNVDLNAKKGKLTLNKLYFTYKTSNRGKLSPYVFKYGDINDSKKNPEYDKKSMDRWGDYRNPKAFEYTGVSGQTITYPHLDYPYTDQEQQYYSGTNAMEPAQWTLKEIQLPTGGTIKIEYEFDDYAFVENKQAQRMFDICGLSKDDVPLTGAQLEEQAKRDRAVMEMDTEDGTSGGGKNRIYFKLEKPLNNEQNYEYSTRNDLFKSIYIDGIEGNMIYFSIYSSLLNEISDADCDFVKGYAEIDLTNYGVIEGSTSGIFEYGFVTLKNEKLASPVNATGMWVSPLTRRSIEHLRANRMDMIFPTASPTGGAASQIMALFSALPGQMVDLMSTTIGFNNFAYLNGWGQKIKANGYSKIRLCDPDFKKIGGGVRVKKITLNDNWKNDNSSSSTNDNSIYGQEYSYTTTKTIDGKAFVISSGVAYEPQVGGEESALRNAIPYTNSIPLNGMYNLFMETPIMDDYYPSASVGYSKVTVKSIAPERAAVENASNNLNYSAAPISIHEFYTAKDFPLIFDKTDMNPGQPMKIPILIPGVFTSLTTRQGKSQGYSIVLNDMAGKPKAITMLTRNGSQIISKQKFIYNTEQVYNENAINKLSSKVQTLEIDDDFNINYITSSLGQSSEVFIDLNEDHQEMSSFGLQFNYDWHFQAYPLLTCFMIMPIPTINTSDNSMRTVVFNKVINRSGILKKIETTTNESTIITENLAFDIESGEPLLTKVTNEFKDPIYNLNYPGHWYYKNMRGAYQNTGLVADPVGSTNFTSDGNGYLTITSVLSGGKVSDYFTKGDLVFVNCVSGASDGKYHIFNIDDANDKVLLINSLGVIFPASATVSSIKVIKSGYKNMQNTKVGNIAFKEMGGGFVDYDPQNHSSTYKDELATVVFENASANKIISASAIEYSDDWQVFCGPYVAPRPECICGLNQSAFDFLNFLQIIHYDGNMFLQNLLIYDKATDTYFNGFTEDLLNSSNSLVSIKSALPLSGKIYFSGYLDSPNNDYYALFHDEVTNAIENNFAKSDCVVKIHSASGNIWHGIISFTNIKSKDLSGEECVPAGIYLQAMVTGEENLINLSLSQQLPGSCGTCENCWSFQGCYTNVTPIYSCGIPEGYSVNPYLAGLKGLWRPKASYAYNTQRTQTDNVRTDGVYNDYVRFPWENVNTKNAKWINASTVTKYSPYGFELENKDALGNYSSATFGYGQSLVTAVGNNARYNEIAFDSFEDYPLECNDDHFRFSSDQSSVNDLFAHTGKHSIRVALSSSISKGYAVNDTCSHIPIDDITNPTLPVPSTNAVHVTQACDCLGEFSPLSNKKYVASVWVKETDYTSLIIPGLANYTAPNLKITITTSGSPVVYTFSANGNVIDGWQQIFETFLVPSNATGINVELVNTSGTHLSYFDDIRIHPFDANMVSYVYDPITLKTLAELDANNFATIYVYDDEGHLNKVNKETKAGIKTVKESKINTKKIYE